jgi:hypothetical protein
VQEIVVPRYVETERPTAPKVAPPKPPLFANSSDDELLGYGVPAEWLADVQGGGFKLPEAASVKSCVENIRPQPELAGQFEFPEWTGEKPLAPFTIHGAARR